VSSASNVAEGQARTGVKEAAHGASVALGSLAEVDTLLAVAEDENYLSVADLAELEEKRIRASQLTLALIRGLRKRIAP
jgi:four helix bundle protein